MEYKCAVCGHVTENRADFVKHLVEERGVDDIEQLCECPDCGETFELDDFVLHLAESGELDNLLEQDGEFIEECPNCGESIYICPLCNDKVTPETFGTHFEDCHLDDEIDKLIEIYQCTWCEEVFESEEVAKAHLVECHEEEYFNEAEEVIVV